MSEKSLPPEIRISGEAMIQPTTGATQDCAPHSQMAWVQIPAMSLTSCVTVIKSLNLSVLQLSPLEGCGTGVDERKPVEHLAW